VAQPRAWHAGDASIGACRRGRPAHDDARRSHGGRTRRVDRAGIFVDGVPESLALGLTIAEGELGVALLAGILLGNLVES
jgi:hypothetical protein